MKEKYWRVTAGVTMALEHLGLYRAWLKVAVG